MTHMTGLSLPCEHSARMKNALCKELLRAALSSGSAWYTNARESPLRTRVPTGVKIRTPTLKSMTSSERLRPAPRSRHARATTSASTSSTTPSECACRAVICVPGTVGRWAAPPGPHREAASVSSTPWHLSIVSKWRRALPSCNDFWTEAAPSLGSRDKCFKWSNCPPNSATSSTRSSGPLPLRVASASSTCNNWTELEPLIVRETQRRRTMAPNWPSYSGTQNGGTPVSAEPSRAPVPHSSWPYREGAVVGRGEGRSPLGHKMAAFAFL